MEIVTPRKNNKLIEAGYQISSESAGSDNIAFTHSVLCQVGLPRSRFDGDRFIRTSGEAWISVQAGNIDEGRGPVPQPIPYGAMPRLAMAWLSTYAKQKGTREIPIGDSAADFLRKLGMDHQGARYVTLRRQMHALAACRLQLGFKGRTFSDTPIQQFDAWVTNRESSQRALWPGHLVLSEHYFSELEHYSVPLDNRALMALRGSSLALDVYTWLSHRLYRIEGRPVTVHWKALREQFGQEYKGKEPGKDFQKKFRHALSDVLAVYPRAKVRQITGGLLLMPSPPPIPHKNDR